MDMTLKRSLWQRLFGLGTIHCCTADKSSPELDIQWIPDSQNVKELLSDLVEAERMEKEMEKRWEAIRLSDEKITEMENRLVNF